MRALVDQFKDAIGRDNLLVLVDQEGGRVQRMKPPHWRKIPAAAAFGKLYRADPESGLKAARAAAQLVARELGAVGVNMNCAPVLDMPIEGAHQVIGARAFGVELAGVVALGRAVAEGILAGGLLPAIKHMPGHGRARSDTHLELPVVTTARDELLATDFAPFKALADLPVAMTAHVVFEAIDPEQPATTSATVIKEIIRGEIGFGGLLDQRRQQHECAVRQHRRPGCADDRGWLRPRTPLQWQIRRDAGSRRQRAAARGRGRTAICRRLRPPPADGDIRCLGGSCRARAGPSGAGMRQWWSPTDIDAMQRQFDADSTSEPREGGLVVDVDGFEGPLDLLLMLARNQKVDLAKISVLALAEQYLSFIEEARQIRLELAADYLVMAAWLAYLKSRLLLPKVEIKPEEVSGEELAAMLAFRLQRLDAMRVAGRAIWCGGHALASRSFVRGAPEGIRLIRRSAYTATVYDLLKAYSDQRLKTTRGEVRVPVRQVWSIKDARLRLERLLGKLAGFGDWVSLDSYLETYATGGDRRTVVASSFGALLELAREGYIGLRQDRAFAPILLQATDRRSART